MRRIARRRVSFGAMLVAVAMCCIATTSARADTLTFMADTGASTEGLGDYTGSLCYDAALGQLLVSLTNTSGFPQLFITGFVFNIQGDADADSLISATNPLLLVTDEPAPPFGTFDAGAALGANFTGGGSPVTGIGDGETGEFLFQITGPDAGLLSADDFFNGGFIVRFRGEPDSDKVPATIIPLPAPVALGAVGLLGVLLGTRRLRRI